MHDTTPVTTRVWIGLTVLAPPPSPSPPIPQYPQMVAGLSPLQAGLWLARSPSP